MLRSNPLHNHGISFSSSISYSRSIPGKFYSPTLIGTVSVTCNISQKRNNVTAELKRRPKVKWTSVYRRISTMEKPELGSASVLSNWESEGTYFSKWELCRVVKELRKYKRYDRALEVYDWMNNRGEWFRLSSSDAGIQLDLIAKVRGVSSAEDYFMNLTDYLKDRRTYGALLNAYVRCQSREKAEPLLEQMRTKGFEEKMEQVFEQMKEDKTIIPNWTTYSTLATMYVKMGKMEKAEECLRNVEIRITGRYKIPYHYLISLYGSVGNKDETYRVWNLYRSIFPTIPNLGYRCAVSSFLKLGDIDLAEKVYKEWLLVKSSFDPRISNLLIGWYVKQGCFDKSKRIFDHMVKVGGKPNAKSWEALVEGHIREKRISEALSCWKRAFSEGLWGWKPRPENIYSFFQLCEEDGDLGSIEVLEGLLSQSGYLQDYPYKYTSSIGFSSRKTDDNGDLRAKNRARIENIIDENEDDDSDMLLNEVQCSL